MVLPSSDDLRAKLSKEVKDQGQARRLETLKTNLERACKLVKKNKKKSHLNNKRLYDRKAKIRSLVKGELVYFYNPTGKPGKCRKFHKPWTGPFKITAKLSELNYEIVSMAGKKFVVHINRLKKAYNEDMRKPRASQKSRGKKRTEARNRTVEEEEAKIGSVPIPRASLQEAVIEPRNIRDPVMDTPDGEQENLHTLSSEATDPTYAPPDTPLSSRELRTTRPEPPVTRSRARLQQQDGQMEREVYIARTHDPQRRPRKWTHSKQRKL
jgi:hypothetical protein